jgi:hypothetical protein
VYSSSREVDVVVQVLSSMSLGPDHFVQRCSVLGASGETATLTFHLQKEERLEPSYRSISVVRWIVAAHQP